MIKNVRLEHLTMLLRGLLWQLTRWRFGFILLKGAGAHVALGRHIHLAGIIKVGNYSTLDLRYTSQGYIETGFSLGDFSIFRASGNRNFVCPAVRVERNVSFGPFCNIGGGFGLSIGPNVIAGPYVSVHPEEHSIALNTPIRAQPIFGTGIQIEGDCWLGAKSTILDGSYLSEGTVLAAGALVSAKETKPYGIYIGMPAKLVRHRERMEPTSA